MATVLGKRKSRTKKAEPSISEEEARAIFQRHFEAQFKPLPEFATTNKPTAAPEPEDLNSDSDGSDGSWGGVSDAGSDSSPPSTTVEVVSHTNTPSTLPSTLSKREARALLSSRVPSTTTDPDGNASAAGKKGKAATAADEDAPTLVKNDLELQRLLSESHLFSKSSTGDSSTEHVGRNRHLATDLRLSALGSKASIFKQAKMPMSHRKGIAAAAEGRETKRRREAKENNIVLERPGAGAKKSGRERRDPRKRERAVDAPAVGRLSNGMLKLSKKDIAEIEDDGRKRGGMTKRKRRR